MLKSNAVAITLPIGDEADFKGVVDLVKNQAIVWHDETQGATFDIVDIPADMVAGSKTIPFNPLLKQLLNTMKIFLINTWKMKTQSQRKKSIML